MILETQDAQQELIAPAGGIDTQPVDNVQQENRSNDTTSQMPSADDQERNFAAMRKKQEELEERLRIATEELQTVKGSITEKPQVIEEEFSEDDLATIGDAKKVVSKEAAKIAKQMISEALSERETARDMKNLKRDYPDFDEVVSKQNVDYLIKNEPEMAEVLRASKNEYKQAVAAYKFIKGAGIHKGDDTQAMKQDAETNSSKPVSPNAVPGRNSVGDANVFSRGLTPELRTQLHNEMIEAIRGG